MSSLVPEEAIEKAARASFYLLQRPAEKAVKFEDLPQAHVDGWLASAKAGLEAAAPLIVAANEPQTLQNAIDLLANLGMSVMHAAREAVNAAYHSVPEGAVDMAAIAALEVAREALIEVRQGADVRASVLRGEGDPK